MLDFHRYRRTGENGSRDGAVRSQCARELVRLTRSQKITRTAGAPVTGDVSGIARHDAGEATHAAIAA